MTHSREAIRAAHLILKAEQMLMSGAPSFDPIILLSIHNLYWKKEQEITKHFREKNPNSLAHMQAKTAAQLLSPCVEM